MSILISAALEAQYAGTNLLIRCSHTNLLFSDKACSIFISKMIFAFVYIWFRCGSIKIQFGFLASAMISKSSRVRLIPNHVLKKTIAVQHKRSIIIYLIIIKDTN